MDITESAMTKKVFKKLSTGSDPVLQEKTITENGEYTPDDGYDGLSKVTVNVEGSGSSDLDLVYVTFWSHDGAKKLHRRAVVKGNTCMCPVTGAIKEIDTPTRESTELYRYIFGGWSTTPNGALNESALEAITADKTVYAYFTAVTRFYTVNFYDGNTLLSTQQVAYGMSATPPNAEKEGYRLDGWSPAYTNITGDTDCYAVWTEKLKFANATWAEIAELSEAGEAASYFKVGDTKQVACGDEIITVTVAGFNHDDLSGGSGKAGMSVVCTKVPTRTALWGGSQYYNACGLLSTKNGILTDLPAELQAVIKSVDKTYDTSYEKGTSPTTATISEKLWLLSAAELGCNFSYSAASVDYTTNCLTRLGSRYELFPSAAVFTDSVGDAPCIYDCNGNGVSYYTRNILRNGAINPAAIFYSSNSKTFRGGRIHYWQDTTPYPICFGFCV